MSKTLRRLIAGVIWIFIGVAIWSLIATVAGLAISSYNDIGLPQWLVPIAKLYNIVAFCGVIAIGLTMGVLSFFGKLPWT